MVTEKIILGQDEISIKDQVSSLLGDMTLDEKIGQMTQVDQRAIEPSDVTRFCLGSGKGIRLSRSCFNNSLGHSTYLWS